tara:strand:- start:3963 stop:4820 length:858 start_codon:yes stop_codon:yes gene_type:complete
MINREKFAMEMELRENVRRAIRVIQTRQDGDERQLRDIVRDLIKEAQTAVTTTAKHANTGINVLEDLLKNSNILSVLEKGYKSLTTAEEQRLSYRNHILVAVEKSLAPEESRKETDDITIKATEEEGGPLAEDISIDVDNPQDDPDFIDVEEKEVVKSDGEVEKEEFAIVGEDKTGRNKAYTDFQTISKVILRAYDDLDDPNDLDMFEEYLIKNLALYFDKYESELQTEVPEPEEAADAEANLDMDAGEEAPAGAEELGAEEAPELELQELLRHLDVDDIIKNLL